MSEDTLSNDDLELIEIRNLFIDETLDGLETASNDLVAFESDPSNTDIIDAIFRTAHSVKGNAAFFELMKLKTLAHAVENVLGALRKQTLAPTRHVVDTVLAGVDAISDTLQRVRNGDSEVRDAVAYDQMMKRLAVVLDRTDAEGAFRDTLKGHLRRLADIDVLQQSPKALSVLNDIGNMLDVSHPDVTSNQSPSASSPTKTAATTTSQQTLTTDEGSSDKTMRIRESAVDAFFEYVGELVIVGETFDSIHSQIRNTGSKELAGTMQQANKAFHTLSRGLQKSIAEIRKVPARNLLRSSSRIVRDVATAQGKEIGVTLKGESILIDKSIAEALDAPLMHMMRNAADHGIELPDARRKVNKDPKGSIVIEVVEEGDTIALIVSDDGAGLNLDKLRQKAVSLGVIVDGQPMTEDAIVNLLFRAGVSTAATVTEVSGRGVGMDVVKKNIDSLAGSINVSTTQGKGSTFTVTVPSTVSTRIIQGIGVQAANERFIIPVDRVVRFLKYADCDIHHLSQKETTARIGERVIPCWELATLLDIPAPTHRTKTEEDNRIIAIIEAGGTETALCVDSIESSRQVVLKDIDSTEARSDLFLGATVLGDGAVVLVLDCEQLLLLHHAPVSPLASQRNAVPLSCSNAEQNADTRA